MTSVELPIFLVAVRDTWVSNKKHPRRSIPAFGTREDAEAFARDCAEQQSEPASLYRVVEYQFSERVYEV